MTGRQAASQAEADLKAKSRSASGTILSERLEKLFREREEAEGGELERMRLRGESVSLPRGCHAACSCCGCCGGLRDGLASRVCSSITHPLWLGLQMALLHEVWILYHLAGPSRVVAEPQPTLVHHIDTSKPPTATV